MREKLLSIEDDFWIENDQGQRAYKVDGKELRIRDTFVLEDAAATARRARTFRSCLRSPWPSTR